MYQTVSKRHIYPVWRRVDWVLSFDMSLWLQVGACLLYTLEKGLGDIWTPEHKEAWALTYNVLADIMIETHNE